MTQEITSPQKKQLCRLVEDALGNDRQALQHLLNRGGKFMQMVRELAIDPSLATSQQDARQIMGANFLGIPEVAECFGSIDPTGRIDLQVPFGEGTLKACAQTHILVADIGLPLFRVQVFGEGLFYERHWYKGQEFATRTDEPGCWRLIRKTPVKDSIGKTWDEQQTLLDPHEVVPSARQIAYLTILHYLTTGEWLFKIPYVHTSDVNSDGYRVFVGTIDSSRFYIDWNDYPGGLHPHDRVGLAAVRQPDSVAT